MTLKAGILSLILLSALSARGQGEANSREDERRFESILQELETHREKVRAETKRPISEVIELAQQGDLLAQAELGKRYYNAYNVERDAQKAYDWYFKAADQGHAVSQYWLSHIYQSQDFGIPDSERLDVAMDWLLKAAEGCSDNAAYQLGELYKNGATWNDNGLKAEVDSNAAVGWYEKAAYGNHTGAISQLALLLIEGRGDLQKNRALGLAWNYLGDQLRSGVSPYEERFKVIIKTYSDAELAEVKKQLAALRKEYADNACVARIKY